MARTAAFAVRGLKHRRTTEYEAGSAKLLGSGCAVVIHPTRSQTSFRSSRGRPTASPSEGTRSASPGSGMRRSCWSCPGPTSSRTRSGRLVSRPSRGSVHGDSCRHPQLSPRCLRFTVYSCLTITSTTSTRQRSVGSIADSAMPSSGLRHRAISPGFEGEAFGA